MKNAILIALAVGALVGILAGVYAYGYDAGQDDTALVYERKIKETEARYAEHVKAITDEAERLDAERQAKADKELAELRRRAADADARLAGLRNQLNAYRRQPVPTAAACARDRVRLAELAVRGAELLERADGALEWCRIELERAGAKKVDSGVQ